VQESELSKKVYTLESGERRLTHHVRRTESESDGVRRQGGLSGGRSRTDRSLTSVQRRRRTAHRASASATLMDRRPSAGPHL